MSNRDKPSHNRTSSERIVAGHATSFTHTPLETESYPESRTDDPQRPNSTPPRLDKKTKSAFLRSPLDLNRLIPFIKEHEPDKSILKPGAPLPEERIRQWEQNPGMQDHNAGSRAWPSRNLRLVDPDSDADADADADADSQFLMSVPVPEKPPWHGSPGDATLGSRKQAHDRKMSVTNNLDESRTLTSSLPERSTKCHNRGPHPEPDAQAQTQAQEFHTHLPQLHTSPSLQFSDILMVETFPNFESRATDGVDRRKRTLQRSENSSEPPHSSTSLSLGNRSVSPSSLSSDADIFHTEISAFGYAIRPFLEDNLNYRLQPPPPSPIETDSSHAFGSPLLPPVRDDEQSIASNELIDVPLMKQNLSIPDRLKGRNELKNRMELTQLRMLLMRCQILHCAVFEIESRPWVWQSDQGVHPYNYYSKMRKLSSYYALPLALKLRDAGLQARCHYWAGRGCGGQADWDAAIKHLEAAIDLDIKDIFDDEENRIVRGLVPNERTNVRFLLASARARQSSHLVQYHNDYVRAKEEAGRTGRLVQDCMQWPKSPIWLPEHDIVMGRVAEAETTKEKEDRVKNIESYTADVKGSGVHENPRFDSKNQDVYRKRTMDGLSKAEKRYVYSMKELNFGSLKDEVASTLRRPVSRAARVPLEYVTTNVIGSPSHVSHQSAASPTLSSSSDARTPTMERHYRPPREKPSSLRTSRIQQRSTLGTAAKGISLESSGESADGTVEIWRDDSITDPNLSPVPTTAFELDMPRDPPVPLSRTSSESLPTNSDQEENELRRYDSVNSELGNDINLLGISTPPTPEP